MTISAIQNLGNLAPAWRELENQAPVQLHAITNERHYKDMVALMNALIDKVG